LQLYFAEQEKKYHDLGLQFDDECVLFTTSTCQYIDTTNYTRAWKRFLKKININSKKFHALRDTFATSLIRRGAKLIEIKEILGHSSIKTTEKYYIYVFPEDKSQTVNLINDFIPM